MTDMRLMLCEGIIVAHDTDFGLLRARVRTVLNRDFDDQHLPWYHRLELADDANDIGIPDLGTKAYVYVSPGSPHSGGYFSTSRLPTLNMRGIGSGQHTA